MVQIKLTLASILVASAIAPAVAQPLGRREDFAGLEARTEPAVHAPKHHHPHPDPNHHHPGSHSHREHEHRQHELRKHHREAKHVVSGAVTEATQPPPTTPTDAAPVTTREYVDELEARTEPVAQPPKRVHHHHTGSQSHREREHLKRLHREHQLHKHHSEGKHVSGAVTEATQPPPTTPTDAAPVTTREYVDELEARELPTGAIKYAKRLHAAHHNRKHQDEKHHHHSEKHHHQGKQHGVSNAVSEATQPPPTDPNAGAPVTTREYLEELFERDFDFNDLD